MSIAEDVLDGLQCSHCGVCFEKEHKQPVLCKHCFKKQINDASKKPQSKFYPKAFYKEL